MDETGNIANKEAEAANNLPEPEVENKPPPSYGFVNPVAFTAQNQPPPPTYTAYERSVPPQGMYPNVIRAQPQPMPNNMIFAANQGAAINDYMGWSFFNCLCCCWPFGIIALILSCIVSEKKKSDNIESAKCLSISTAIWNGITTVLGIGLNIFIVIYYTNMQR